MSDSIIVGLAGVIFAFIIINTILPIEKKVHIDKTRNYLIIFLIGIIVTMITESINLKGMYNTKQFQTAIKMLSMQ